MQKARLTISGNPAGVWVNLEHALAGMHEVLRTARAIVAAQPAPEDGRGGWQMETGSMVTPKEVILAGHPGKVGIAMVAPDFMLLTVEAEKVSTKRMRWIRAHLSARLAEAAYASGAMPRSSSIEGAIETD